MYTRLSLRNFPSVIEMKIPTCFNDVIQSKNKRTLVTKLLLASTVTIGGLVYDFQQNFPDMNLGGPKCTNDRGIVQNVLPSNRIPVYNSSSSHPTVTSATTFGEWFTSTPGTNLPIAYLFNLTQAGNWFTYTPANFYIINGQGFGNNQPNTNQFFTFQMHAVFTYLGYPDFSLCSLIFSSLLTCELRDFECFGE